MEEKGYNLEVWKDIPGYEGRYQASTFGNIRTLDRLYKEGSNGKKVRKGAVKKLTLNNKGYYSVSIWDLQKGKNLYLRVHILVAMTFLGHTVCGMKKIVDHIDNDKLNNRVENLQITTQRHNSSKDKKDKSSKYTGVCFDKSRDKWISVIFADNKLKHIGRYNCEFAAHIAYVNQLNIINNERVQ